MTARLENTSGQIKEVKVGFSWTTLFFFFFVPLFRKDWKWLGIMIGSIIAGLMLTTILNIDANVSLGLNIAFAVLYNNCYINDLLAKGWMPASEVDEKILNDKLRWKIYFLYFKAHPDECAFSYPLLKNFVFFK